MSKVVVFDSANCFVCNDYMGPYRNNLTDTTEFSETPIFSFLGKKMSKNFVNWLKRAN